MTHTTKFRTTKVKFIKEWTPEQFKAMDKAIQKHFEDKTIAYRDGPGLHTKHIYKHTSLDMLLGFAYTSSGIWACYGICNIQVYFDADNIYHYDYFTIGEDGNFYAVLTDNDENELTIKL